MNVCSLSGPIMLHTIGAGYRNKNRLYPSPKRVCSLDMHRKTINCAHIATEELNSHGRIYFSN